MSDDIDQNGPDTALDTVVTVDDAPPVDEIAELKAQLEEERQQREEERRLRVAAESRLSSTESATAEHETRLAAEVEARISAEERATDAATAAAETALRSAKTEFIKAQEEGRYADAAELSEQIADAKLALNGAKYRKGQIEQYRQRAEQEAKAPLQVQSSDPAQRILQGVSQASNQWLRAHPDILSKMGSDERYYAKIAALDNEAFASGIDRDTPEYFSYIEQKLTGDSQGAGDAGATRKAPQRAAGGNASAATPARRGGTGATQAGRTITIDDVVNKFTPSMREAAIVTNPKLPEKEAFEVYARGLIKEKQRDPGFLPDFKL